MQQLRDSNSGLYLKGCLLTLIVLMILTLVLWSAASILVRHMVVKNMTPEEVAAMDAFFEDPVDIPEEWTVVEPFPEEVIELAKQIQGELNKDETLGSRVREIQDKIGSGEELTAGELEEARSIVGSASQALQLWETLVNHPDYEMEAFRPKGEDSVIPDFVSLQTSVKVLCVRTYLLDQSGRCREGLESAQVPLKMARRHPASSLMTHLIAIGAIDVSLPLIADLARSCTDETALRDTLKTMNDLEPKVLFGNLENAFLIDQVSVLRDASRRGEDVDFHSGEPQIEIMKETTGFMIETAADSDPNMRHAMFLLRLPLISKTIWQVLYSVAVPNFSKAVGREEVAQARFDLTRFEIASRLEEFSGDRQPRSFAELVPEYFPEEPMDPFSDKPYLWSEEYQVPYSVGPDGKDDGLTLIYDPSAENKEGDLILKD